jgi:hypothetical protein
MGGNRNVSKIRHSLNGINIMEMCSVLSEVKTEYLNIIWISPQYLFQLHNYKNETLICKRDSRTCLGLHTLSSGRWLIEERVIMANYVTDVHFFFPLAQQPNAGQSRLILDVS